MPANELPPVEEAQMLYRFVEDVKFWLRLMRERCEDDKTSHLHALFNGASYFLFYRDKVGSNAKDEGYLNSRKLMAAMKDPAYASGVRKLSLPLRFLTDGFVENAGLEEGILMVQTLEAPHDHRNFPANINVLGDPLYCCRWVPRNG